MREVTFYIADDGTQFDDEFECTIYEMKMNYPCLDNIEIFDDKGYRLEDVFDDNTYDNSYTVVVHTEEEVKGLREVAHYFGWCEWETITEEGAWRWVRDTRSLCSGRFEMVNE